MNFEAAFIIGGFALLFGALLYFPSRYFLRKKVKASQSSVLSERISKPGISFYGSMITVLLVGFSQESLAPNSIFGMFIKTIGGKFLFSSAVIILFTVAASIFKIKVSGNGKTEKNENDKSV